VHKKYFVQFREEKKENNVQKKKNDNRSRNSLEECVGNPLDKQSELLQTNQP
jgi:hypothetical protein